MHNDPWDIEESQEAIDKKFEKQEEEANADYSEPETDY